MATLTFGYQPGDGTGSNISLVGGITTIFENDSGSTLYVDRIDLLNVTTTTVTSIQLGIYSVPDADFPWELLALSNILTSLTLGSNSFTFSSPISVGPEVKIAVELQRSGTLRCDGATCTTKRAIGASGSFTSPFRGNSWNLQVLPVLMYGSTIGPGTVSNLDVPEVFNEPASGGNPNLIIPSFLTEPLSGGAPNTRVSRSFTEPLTGGPPASVLVAEMFTEVLHLVLPEPYMSDTPFPGFGNSVSDPSVPAAKDPFSSGLPGLGFSVHRIPMFNTTVDEAASGNEIATSLSEFPRWKYELTYEYLEDKTGAASSLKKILGFFLSRRGRWDTWLFKDPDDYLVDAGVCGTTDGVTTQFYFCRTIGDFIEPVGQVDTANTINLYLDGALIDPANYTITMPNKVVFNIAPAAGTLTADFQFFFVCRFMEDQQDYEKFADKLWALQTCEFRSVLQQ